ncbi:MAG: carbohydrate-binding domain-containing protein [Clostridia bacterium]|nr:carbohydrate-binding domain-containing protein [Clostridia bacterium]
MVKKIFPLFLALLLVFSFTGCKKQRLTDAEKEIVSKIHTEKQQKIDDIDWKEEDYSLVKLENKIFKSESRNVEYNDGDVAITKGGTYVLKGYYYGGIVVDTNDEVNLVFNTVQLFSNGEPAINVLNAKKVNIVLQEDTINTINDKSVNEKETGAITSNSDIFFIGGGALFIESLSTGIMCEKSVTFGDCSLDIIAGLNGVNAKKCIHCSGGSVGIYSVGNALKGLEHIEVDGGYVQIKNANEGLESLYIDILDGVVDIVSTEDGINGTDKREEADTENSNALLTIKGGKITIDAGGDGIDVNGEIAMTGGTVIVYGTNNQDEEIIDFDKTFEFDGGTIICAGDHNMSWRLTTNKASALFVTGISFPENSTIIITDNKNEKLLEFRNLKSFETFYMVSDELKNGGTYNMVSDSKTINNITAQQ